MDGREANCPSRLSSEQALDDFGGEGGKRGQAAEEAGYRKQLPGQWEMRIEVEHTNGNANQVAAHDVRSERKAINNGFKASPSSQRTQAPNAAPAPTARKFSGVRLLSRCMRSNCSGLRAVAS